MSASSDRPAKRSINSSRAVAAVVGLVLAGLLWVLLSASPNPSENAESPLLGKPAPALETTTLDGASFNLAQRKGSWVVLNFFNSTCVPCQIEHPLLVAFDAEQNSSTDAVELYSVVNDDSDESVNAYFAANGGSWPRLRDTNGAIAISFGVAKVPETWIIDPNGFVRLRIAGQLNEGLLQEQLAALKEMTS